MTEPSDLAVCVLGSTGFLGRAVVAELRRSGFRVLSDRLASGERIDIVSGGTVLDGVVLDADFVINAAGRAHGDHTDQAAFWAVNTMGAANVARACVTSPRTRQLVHISSQAVGEGGLDPGTWPGLPSTPYGASKAAGEFAVAMICEQGQLTCSIIRPAGVYGDGAPGAWGRIRRMVSRGWPVPVQSRLRHYDIIHVDDLAVAIVGLLGASYRLGIYNLSGSSAMTIAGYAERVGEELGLRPRFLRVPDPVLGAARRVTQRGARICERWWGIERQVKVFVDPPATTHRVGLVRLEE